MIAAVQSSKSPTSHLMSVAKFERFFLITAGLDVDKQDLKRYSDFINRKVYDLLVQAEAVAKANQMAGLSSSRSTCRSPGACSKASTNSRISTNRSSCG
jgi:hypothetical protein